MQFFLQPVQLYRQQNRWWTFKSLDYSFLFFLFEKTIWESERRPGQLLFLKIYNLMMANGERGGHCCNWFSILPLEGIGWLSASCFKRRTYRPLAIVVEKLQNLLSCLKFIKYLTFLRRRFQGFAFTKLSFVKTYEIVKWIKFYRRKKFNDLWDFLVLY